MNKYYQLFPISVLETNIPVQETWLHFINRQKFKRMENNTGLYSHNNTILNDMPVLSELIMQKVKHYMFDHMQYDAQVDFCFTTSWVNKHLEDDYAPYHDHVNSLLSGVYYLKIPKNSGKIQFKNPSEYISKTINFPTKLSYIHNCDTYSFEPKEGMLLLFPSYLEHMVTPSETSEERYSLAFNTFVTGSFGQGVNFINI